MFTPSYCPDTYFSCHIVKLSNIQHSKKMRIILHEKSVGYLHQIAYSEIVSILLCLFIITSIFMSN